jgi:hypothetical protein
VWLLPRSRLSHRTQPSLVKTRLSGSDCAGSSVGRQSMRKTRGASDSARGAWVHETLMRAGEQETERAGQATGL